MSPDAKGIQYFFEPPGEIWECSHEETLISGCTLEDSWTVRLSTPVMERQACKSNTLILTPILANLPSSLGHRVFDKFVTQRINFRHVDISKNCETINEEFLVTGNEPQMCCIEQLVDPSWGACEDEVTTYKIISTLLCAISMRTG